MESSLLCPICDAGAAEPVWSDVIPLSHTESFSYCLCRCARCGHHFLHPLPSQQIIQAFYKGLGICGPYAFGHDSVGERHPALKMWIAQHRFSEQGTLLKRASGRGLAILAEVIVGRLVSFSLGVPLQYPTDASMLDIGCGAGDWLLYMRQAGYQNVMGQDIAGPAVERLAEQGMPAAGGDLCELQLPSSSFDLIRMEHVLEHLPDPVAYVREAKRLLKPGGRLVVNTPWIESFSFRFGRQHWASLAPLYHLGYFSRRSLSALADRVGLHLQRHRCLPVFEVMIGSVGFRTGPAVHRLLRTQPLRSVVEPLYGTAMRLLLNGDFLTAELVNPSDAP
jgi:SAM-dependent methyltransferase